MRRPLALFALALLLLSCRQDQSTSQKATPTTAPVLADSAGSSPDDLAALGFTYPAAPSRKRSQEAVLAGSASCVVCHSSTDSHSMHQQDQGLSCVDCHGGNPKVPVVAGLSPTSAAYEFFKRQSHVPARLANFWPPSGANPKAPGVRTNQESVDYIRFVNPGDLRAARAACASCHNTPDHPIVTNVEKSMMAHGAMLWQAALYNNGAINRKDPVFGEAYLPDGTPRKLTATTRPTTRQAARGVVAELWPLPRWEISQPGNVLRVFERGGKIRPQLGLPEVLEEPGRPDVKLSLRGYGTDVRTDPVFLGLQKTRLLDPTLNAFGTNDHPGDYRASGCSACHVVYANDRSPAHSGKWAKFGNSGRSFSKDPTVNRDGAVGQLGSGENGATTRPTAPLPHSPISSSGHPIEHKFVRNMPTSTCIVCHVHPGTNVLNSYLGYIWWDNESDGQFMYPRNQKYPTSELEAKVSRHNPEQAAARGLWSNQYPNDVSHVGEKAGPNFLERTSELNPHLPNMQFADFHGHGWVFRAVHKRDRKGQLLDAKNNLVKQDDPKKWDKAVHLKDIHLERGMHCVDCHFEQDNHGDGRLHAETRAAVVIDCVDCHGSLTAKSHILQFLDDPRSREANAHVAKSFTGTAAPKTLTNADLARRRNFLTDRFESREGKLFQKSALDDKHFWPVPQTPDTTKVKPPTQDSALRTQHSAAYAHTVRKDNATWGDCRKNTDFAHSTMSCYACHTSWNTSCFGCHLPMRANQRKEMLHNEGTVSRNYTNYNFQTLRDDIFMLGIDSTAKDHKIVPVRSACAVMVSSQDANRQWIYSQQQTISAEGFAGTAFSPYFPHTVRTTETKRCTDCHVSKDNDNNAVMAQLLLHGTNAVNFVGRFAYVGLGSHGLQAVEVTERDEPQAVIGSRLHELAYPDFFRQHVARGRKLKEAHTHHAHPVLDLQLRGEYLYAACGPDGFVAFDVANVDNKGFSERILTAPVSPLGQRLYVKSKYATSICSPSTLAIDPTRPRRPENQEQPIHPLYAYLYLTDRDEGLIVIGNPATDTKNKPGVATLLDGNPDNNFLRRALTFNPDGILKGAKHMTLHGTTAYVLADAGLVVLDMDNPLSPKLVTTITGFSEPRKIATQFRYAFVIDRQGLHVLDITNPHMPQRLATSNSQLATLPLPDARDVYLSRTYAYVAAGKQGLVIVDVERPEHPRIETTFTADGAIDDATAVRIGMTNTSIFAYVADGHNGLRVLQLTSDQTPGYLGFSPRPRPRLIATHKTPGHAIALSEGLDRDRAVDESGNQLAVFGRKGSRPFNLPEQQRLYLKTNPDGTKSLYTVSDTPTTDPCVEGSTTATPGAPPTTAPATQPTQTGPRIRFPRR